MNLVIVFVRATARRHYAKFARLRPVKRKLIIAQVSHVLDAVVDAIRLEVLKVQTTARIGGMNLARKVYKLSQ